MVMADPDYGVEGRVATPVPEAEGNDRQRRSRDGVGPFDRLEGTAQEGEAIGKLLRLMFAVQLQNPAIRLQLKPLRLSSVNPLLIAGRRRLRRDR